MTPWCNRHPYLFTLVVWAVLASALLWVSVAHAQSTTLFEVTAHDTTSDWFGSDENWRRQTFTLSVGDTTTFTDGRMRLVRQLSGAGDVRAEFYELAGTNDSSLGSLVCTADTDVPIDTITTASGGESVDFIFSSCPAVSDGFYALSVRRVNGTTGEFGTRGDSGAPLAGGIAQQSLDDGGSFSDIAIDFTFRVQGVVSSGATPTPTPTPEPDNYEYLTTVRATLATTAADQTDVAVQFPINALNLVDSGYLDTDVQGLLVVQDNDVVLPMVHAGVNAASWWIPFLGNTAPGQTRSADLYTSPNPNPLRPQSLWLENASESADVVHSASFNITDELTLEVDAVEARTLPTASVCLLCKTGQWEVMLDGATLTADIETAAGTQTLTHTGITAGTSYNVKVTFDNGSDLLLSLNNTVVDSALGLSTTLATTTNDIETALFPGWVGRARVGDTSVSSPSYVLDLQFEPTHLTQTDAGDAGDGWTWEGTIEDQSTSGNGATYLFVRDMSIWTTEVDPISSNEDLPPALTNNELADLFDAPNIATGTTDDILTGDDTLEQLVESPGLTSSGAWFLFVSLIVIGGGGTLLVRVSQQAVVGVLFGGFALFGAGALGWLGWIWVTLGCFILVIGMSAVLWLRR